MPLSDLAVVTLLVGQRTARRLEWAALAGGGVAAPFWMHREAHEPSEFRAIYLGFALEAAYQEAGLEHASQGLVERVRAEPKAPVDVRLWTGFVAHLRQDATQAGRACGLSDSEMGNALAAMLEGAWWADRAGHVETEL